MHIVVCINRIPDPEVPWYDVKLNASGTAPVLEHVSYMIGPFDENALEVALQHRDAVGGRVTALSLGPDSHQEILRRALAIRCDAAVHIKEDRTPDLDSASVARLLAAAVRKLGDVDLVLCGRQVGDWDGGQVGPLLAEELGFTCVTLVRRIESEGAGAVRVSRETSDGSALVDARLPAVGSVTNTAENKVRVAKIKDVMAARRATITAWSAADLGVPAEALAGLRRVAVERVYFPEIVVKVKMLDASAPETAADQLARYILELKLPTRTGDPSTGGSR